MSAGEIKTCSQCGAPIQASAQSCKFCGAEFAKKPEPVAQSAYSRTPPQSAPPPRQAGLYAGSYQQRPYGGQYQQPQRPYYPQGQPVYNSGKSKVAAGILGIFLGGIGVHKFYLGHVGLGIVYLLFCWTGIPAIVGFIEGIVYLCSDEQKFQAKYVRRR